MKLLSLLSTLTLFLVSSISNYNPNNPSTQTIDNTVYITPYKGNKISESSISYSLINGSKFRKHFIVSGYTATDDLWTIISSNDSNPSVYYDVVSVQIVNLHIESWNNCLAFLQDYAGSIPASITWD